MWWIVFSVLAISLLVCGYFYFYLFGVVPKSENKLTEVMTFLTTDTTNYDVVFVGGSTVECNFDPQIIDSVCEVNSMNVSIKGCSIAQQLYLLKKYLENHAAPKMIVLGVDYRTLSPSILPFRYTDYYEYMNDSLWEALNVQAVPRFKFRKILSRTDLFMKYSAKSDYQKFAGLFAALHVPKHFDNLSDEPLWLSGFTRKGYFALDVKWQPSSDKMLLGEEKLPIEETGKTLLNYFIENAKLKTSKVIIVFSPGFSDIQRHFYNSPELFSTFNAACAKGNIPFWNYQNNSMCNDKKYFYDMYHMNKTGAEKFSVVFAEDLKKYMQQ